MKRFADLQGLYSDHYELTMAQGYLHTNKHEKPAVFDYFFRSCPFSGGYVVFAGLGDVLQFLTDFEYSDNALAHLKSAGFSARLVEYLDGVKFRGDVYSCREGEVVFPYEPVLRVEGTLFETQLVETAILNLLNYESLVATKAARIVQSAGGIPVVDFGLRRAQGYGGVQGSRAAIIGGCAGTSNVYTAARYGIESTGTMAHSWVQVFGSDLDAFRAYAEQYPDNAILLVDTYDTLLSGIPCAITVAGELKKKGHKLRGIRLDSGDLAYLSKRARDMLDESGFADVKIFVSNQLDEYLIKSLCEQHAPIDAFGVGTKLITGVDDAALDGVYKLSSYDGAPNIKLSDDPQKTTLPGMKKVVRYCRDGMFEIDGVMLESETNPEWIIHPAFPEKRTNVADLQGEQLLQRVMREGRIIEPDPPLDRIAKYARERLSRLPEEHKRFEFPHRYRVGISKRLHHLREQQMRKVRY